MFLKWGAKGQLRLICLFSLWVLLVNVWTFGFRLFGGGWRVALERSLPFLCFGLLFAIFSREGAQR